MFDKRMEERTRSCRIKFTSWTLSAFPPHPLHPKSPALSPSLLSTQGCQQESEQDLPAEQTSSAGVPPALEMEQELYYASISFHKMKNTYKE